MFIQDANLKPNTPLKYCNMPQYIILHHADMNGTVEQVDQVHKDEGFSMIGYNYYVRKDGSIWRGRPEGAIGANCYNYNMKSISICAEGNFMIDIMPSAQKQSIGILVKYIQSEYNNRLKVVGHKELYNTDCPGINYPIDDIKNGIIETAIQEPIKEEVEEMINDFTPAQRILMAKFVADGHVPADNNIAPIGPNITPNNGGIGWKEVISGRIIEHMSRVCYHEFTSDGRIIITDCGQTRQI